MAAMYSRNIETAFAGNLRDLGGYINSAGQQTRWRRIYRSAEITTQSADEVAQLRRLTGVSSVLDLRGAPEIRKDRVELLAAGGIRYQNTPLAGAGPTPGTAPDRDMFSLHKNMGEVYLYLMHQAKFGQSLVEALEFVANPENQPVIFHCAVGKDRTGLLSAFILSILGIRDPDIINDYHLTTKYIQGLKERLIKTASKNQMMPALPDYAWESTRESMILVLSETRREYGSPRGYLESCGGGKDLFKKLEESFLEAGKGPDR